MKLKLTRKITLSLLVLALAAAGALAGEKELHQAWLAYCQPALDPASYPMQVDAHRARQQAINLAQTALQDKKDAAAFETLGYFYLRDFQYRNAQEQFESAAKRDSKEPRLRYLLGQVRAILLVAEPEKMREKVKDSVAEFRRAAALDPDNAMPLLQAASVSFDCDCADLALPLVSEALRRPEYRLYNLATPQDLVSDPGPAALAWWWAQSELWSEMINRTANCARSLVLRGNHLAVSGQAEKAAQYYQQAAEIGAKLSRATPALADAVGAGLEVERQALVAQSGAAATPEQKARLSRIEAAQQVLQRQWRMLQEREHRQPPASVEERLNNQRAVAEAVLASL